MTAFLLSVVGIAVLGIVLLFVTARASVEEEKRRQIERRARLLSKYRDPEVVDALMARSMWVGQTAEQVRDSLGDPVDIDQKVLKTKTKETWKYNQTGQRRFGLRVTIENGEVVGWDQKD